MGHTFLFSWPSDFIVIYNEQQEHWTIAKMSVGTLPKNDLGT